MWQNFVSAISWDRPVIRWAAGALAALVFSSFVAALLGHFFQVSFADSWGMLVIMVVVGGTLAVGLAAETAYKAAGKEPPSFLPKAVRVLIGVALAMAVAFLGFQLWMDLGASRHFFSPFIWVLVGDLLVIPLTVLACGLAAMAFGQRMGKEFLPAVVLFSFLGSGAMGLTNLGQTLVSPATLGQLYYYFDNEECTAQGDETPELTTPWFLTVQDNGWFTPDTYLAPNGCEAQVVKWSNPAHRAWVRAAEKAKEENRLPTFLEGMGWILGSVFGLGVLAWIGGHGFRAIRNAWTGGQGRGSWLMDLFLVLGILAICGGGCNVGARLLGLTPEVEVRQLRHELAGGPNPFYRTFTVGPQAKQELGVPDQTEIGYLCMCGSGANLAVYGQWTAWSKYNAEMYPMHPRGCGAQLTFDGDQLYFVWNRARLTSPPIQFLRGGESMACPDLTTVTAPSP